MLLGLSVIELLDLGFCTLSLAADCEGESSATRLGESPGAGIWVLCFGLVVATAVSTGAFRDSTGSRCSLSISVVTVQVSLTATATATATGTGDGLGETGVVATTGDTGDTGAVAGGGVRGADLPSNESMDEDELRIESVKQRAGRIYLDAGLFEFAIVVVGDSG